MREVAYVLLFLTLFFVIPYISAVWMMKRVCRKFTSLEGDGWGWRILYGLAFLGCAALAFVVVITLIWLVTQLF